MTLQAHSLQTLRVGRYVSISGYLNKNATGRILKSMCSLQTFPTFNGHGKISVNTKCPAKRRQSTSVHTLMSFASTVLSPRLSGTKRKLV